MRLSLQAILSESTQFWHKENCLVEPTTNVMSSFYAQRKWELLYIYKSPTPIITDSSSQQLQDISDYIVWHWQKGTRTKLKGRDCHWEVRGYHFRFQLQTAIFHTGSQAKVLPNDGWKAFIKQNVSPRVSCSWRELRKEAIGAGCDFSLSVMTEQEKEVPQTWGRGNERSLCWATRVTRGVWKLQNLYKHLHVLMRLCMHTHTHTSLGVFQNIKCKDYYFQCLFWSCPKIWIYSVKLSLSVFIGEGPARKQLSQVCNFAKKKKKCRIWSP